MMLFVSGTSSLGKELGTHEAVVGLIAEALQKPLDHDLRSELSKPLFRREVTTLADLKFGTVLTGNSAGLRRLISGGRAMIRKSERESCIFNPPYLSEVFCYL